MSLHAGSGTSLGRILREHRPLVIAIAVLLLLNAIVYAAVVYPLGQRVGSVSERTQEAEAELLAARRLHSQAATTLTGKTRASEELERFYMDILPGDLASARRLSYARLDQLAREANLRPSGTTWEVSRERDHTLARVGIEMTLTGPYAGIRRFIHQLEQATEFVAIDRVTLREDFNDDSALSVQLELSTYYRDGQP
jgi:Tfp pilus assembly protein PilO